MEDTQIQSIVVNITKINDNYEPSFYEMVVRRLLDFGYKTTENDCFCLAFSIEKVVNKIKNSCNITDIPKKLTEVLVDRICGEFLFVKKQSNQLTLDNIDLDVAVKTIKEGDTEVTFAINEGSSTDEARLNALINYLMTSISEGDLECYRRLKW